MPNTPTPEPRAYIEAQVAALLDPNSARDTVLVTPGSPMPRNIPRGLTVAQTSRGVVITKDPRKVDLINKGTDEQVGQALFGYAYDQRNGYSDVATAEDANGIPVAELAVKPGDEQKAMGLAEMLAPSGGRATLSPRMGTVNKRLQGLMGLM